MSYPTTTNIDPRRNRPVEVRRDRHNAQVYWLTIDGQVWSEVEWSPSRRAWCIQDAAGRCLAHVEHIHAQDADREAAIRTAKRMIRDGSLPTPEEADEALRNRERGAGEVDVDTVEVVDDELGELIEGDLTKSDPLKVLRTGERR
jgi:hypothetical protein